MSCATFPVNQETGHGSYTATKHSYTEPSVHPQHGATILHIDGSSHALIGAKKKPAIRMFRVLLGKHAELPRAPNLGIYIHTYSIYLYVNLIT